MRCPSIPETPGVKAAVAALCTYETAAIISGFVPSLPTLPTITVLQQRRRIIGVALVAALVVHFWVPTPEVIPATT